MPVALKTLDEIAREKQQDVFFVSFHTPIDAPDLYDDADFDWENSSSRKEAIRFLNDAGVAYEHCFPPQPGNVLILVMPYKGGIFIDIPLDPESPVYQRVLGYFKDHYDQSVIIWPYSLNQAMQNAEHDEPGFWDDM